MRPLAALERFLERLFERPTARLLRARLEPVTLARRLERAIDEERRIGAGGMLAPTRFTIEVSVADAAALAHIVTLEEDLAGAALAHARHRGYRIPESPRVALVGAARIRPGEIRVAAAFAAGRRPAAEPRPVAERTLVHALPSTVPPGMIVRVLGTSGPPRDIPLDGSPLMIGRGADADVMLPDPLVSRHHARLAPRGGRLVVSDLGSTNGTRVNGDVVREAVVGPGDQIDVGSSRLEIMGPGQAGEAPWTPG